ncbi:MAG: diacylglycerol kinase family protein [Chloroflexota bacterium]|nr:diacylglycerol kinase family protein [Chloroflexota bacterium]MDH5243114.1 diacylglycerol kinase family protein [Chloroflexota bacterium]
MDTLDAQRPPLVIVNPTASHLADPKRRATVLHELDRVLVDRFGRGPDWAPETRDGAREALANAAGRPLIVVAGGDGTVREVAETVGGTGIPLAIIPGGTGNVLAGAMRIRGLRGAIAAIHGGVPRRIDLGMARWASVPVSSGPASAPTDSAVHERPFTVACGMGFDAKIMTAAEREWKRRLRFGAYVGAALREAARLEPARFRIQADEAEIDIVGLLVLVANCGDLIPGRLGARQPLDPTDGLLDLLVIGGRGLFAGLRGAADALLRTGEQEGAVIRRAVRRVRVEADPAQPIETDGDVHPPSWLEASVLPGALTVLVPPT